MSLPPKNLRHSLKSLVPNWLADIPGLNVGFAVLFVFALIGDLLIEAMYQGVFAAWPGKGTATALPYVGQSRGLVRGFDETDDEYSARLRAWLDTWTNAGSDETLARLVQTYLGGIGAGDPPVVRVVDRRGQFVTIDENGDVTRDVDSSWNWDETQFPERDEWWSDLWVIVYLIDGRWPTYTNLSDSDFLAAWGTYDGLGTGFEIPRGPPNDLKHIISVFKGAHNFMVAVIFTDDTAVFIPGSLGSTYPNGYWGNWSRAIADVQTPSRSHSTGAGFLRYLIPDGGG